MSLFWIIFLFVAVLSLATLAGWLIEPYRACDRAYEGEPEEIPFKTVTAVAMHDGVRIVERLYAVDEYGGLWLRQDDEWSWISTPENPRYQAERTDDGLLT